MNFDKNINIFEEYQEIIEELLEPIEDPGMEPCLKYQLYLSKHKYLKILQKDCIKSLNQVRSSKYLINDLSFIKQAVKKNQDHIRDIVLCELRRVLN